MSVRRQGYGSTNLTVVVKNGIPMVETARLVKMRRKKYPKKPY